MHIPSDQPTMPNPALRSRGKPNTPKVQSPLPPAPPHAAPQMLPKQNAPRRKKPVPKWLWLVPLGVIFMGIMFCGGILAIVGISYSNKILPGVSIAGVDVGGLTEEQAQIRLNSGWRKITLRDDDRVWEVNPQTFGLSLDTGASAEKAFDAGRASSGFFAAAFGTVDVAPVVAVDVNVARVEFERIAAQVNIQPRNAGVELVDGRVRETAAINGRQLNIQATITHLQNSRGADLADSFLDLVMSDVEPQITDASSIVQEAERLLSSPLDIRVFDPVTGDSIYWSLPPDAWGQWLTAQSDPNSPIGLTLSADENAVRDYLTQQADLVLDDTRFIDIEQGVVSVRDALSNGDPTRGYIQVQHRERQHVVQRGESITSIAWDYGIPYLYIQQVNNGIEGVSVGQTITIPPADMFLEESVVANKRIVVSISQQKTWVYQDGQLIWEWVSSTGIADSPTWPGVYQILSHEPNAYAGNWNLNMPFFMGVYRPVPGSDFTNGFHGFPTRGGGQLLWENSLGTRVTYGCILLHDNHVQQLYDWAETGVIVEIQA